MSVSPFEKAARAEGWQILNGEFMRSTGDALAPWEYADGYDPTDVDASWEELCDIQSIKVKLKIEVSDTITLSRTATLEIEAFSSEEAIELAMAAANKGDLDWTEEQIDNTPYEAKLAEDA